jgi:DAACS family dicarboxylate/amino acid:cation (Na+ or H+) symporter
LVGFVLGVAVGVWLGPRAASFDSPAKLVLRVLGALAPAIILLAVVNALMTADVRGRLAGKMASLLVLNTLVAILVGLGVANLVRPGSHAHSEPPATPPNVPKGDVIAQLLDNVPDSLLRPLVENKVIGVVLIAVGVGLAARRLSPERKSAVEHNVGALFDIVITLLHWTIAFVPLAVFGKVASIIPNPGFRPFIALGWFVGAVRWLVCASRYLMRIRLGSWARRW